MLTSLDANGWPGMGTMPRRDGTGPSWPESYTGGASALLVYRQGANLGLQGLRFAPEGCDPPPKAKWAIRTPNGAASALLTPFLPSRPRQPIHKFCRNDITFN